MAYSSKEQQRAYAREWLKKRRNEWLLDNGPCAKCGSWEDLEIDHINPADKAFSVSRLWSRSKQVRDKELSKCQVLCHSCHKEKHRGTIVHGTVTAYDEYGCRCEFCKSAKQIKRARLAGKSLALPVAA